MTQADVTKTQELPLKPIAIFNTDTVPDALARVHGQYPDMFMQSLLAVNPALTFARFDVHNKHYPEAITDYAGVLITGSKSAAYDTDDWITQLKTRIQHMAREGVPMVGICFGHQIIHQALGGQVVKAPGGWCVGVHRNKLTAAAAQYGPAGKTFRLLSSHQDQVVKLAPNSQLLASSDHCAIAMTSVGNNILTLQGHPEFTRDYAKVLMDRRQELIGQQVHQRGLESLTQPLDDREVLGWMLQTLGAGG